MKRHPNSADGFSLIEILVAIAVVGILAAITYSGVRSFIGKAYEVEAQSNLRNITLAVNLAAQDLNGKYPVMRNYPWEPVLRPDGTDAAWMQDLLVNYVEAPVDASDSDVAEIFRNPAVENRGTPAWLAEDPQHSHYRYNTLVAPGQRMAIDPAKAMLTFCTAWPDWPASDMPVQSNGGGLYVGYADSSIRFVSYESYLEQTGGSESSGSDFFSEGWGP